MIALCGKVWVPNRDPGRFPVCPECKEIFEGLPPGGGDGDAVTSRTAVTAVRGSRRGVRLEPPRLFAHGNRPLLVGLVSVILLIAFEAMAVATAMPRAVAELHGLPYYAWAFSGFVVTSLFAMVVAGEVCDARGPTPADGRRRRRCSPSACSWPGPPSTWPCSWRRGPCRAWARARSSSRSTWWWAGPSTTRCGRGCSR